ncbi:enamine deaminase RidA (YjgF/YER057c/UK114 family) [Ancylobacter aquaticus]|uniref:Enamine deaminase RidA (YjgF/YER057c/UK114 family) n=1 Tax=Ancylobacter aquaticus TaxID=100 RepID=A0A4R1H805_ANCAQ|nr:RidA family protein [Ancylobacter aquaticus]TCK16611.1 enamine deaminase RidA (YjgF/YER057c/UK114 family) [Ancylobacter aquaticus]
MTAPPAYRSPSDFNARAHSRAQDIVFLSAQLGNPQDGLDAQVDQAVAKIIAALAGAGAGPGDVVKLGLFYHRSLIAHEALILSRLRAAFPADPPPVVTAIPLHVLVAGALVQIEAIALHPQGARHGQREAVSADATGFSRALRCGDLVFVGAQMARDAQGQTLHGGDIVGQAKTTIGHIGEALKEVGADLSCVAKLNTYYVGHGTTEDWAMAARVRSDAFRKPGPGATGVPVPGPYPGDVLLRQEAIGLVAPDGTAAHRDTSWPEGTWDWPIPVSFEQGLKINDLLILGGQISATPKGEAVFPGDLAAQARNTMECIDRILAGFGAGIDDLAKVTVFLATAGDDADIACVLGALTPFFSNGLPALTFVPLSRLGLTGLEIEIEGVGAIRA